MTEVIGCCKEKDLFEGAGDCQATAIELHPTSACPAPLICPPPPDMGPIRRRKWNEITPMPLVPNTEAIQRELQEHAKQTVIDPAQEHMQVQADLKAGVDAQQHKLAEMRNEQASKPLKSEEIQFAVGGQLDCEVSVVQQAFLSAFHQSGGRQSAESALLFASSRRRSAAQGFDDAHGTRWALGNRQGRLESHGWTDGHATRGR